MPYVLNTADLPAGDRVEAIHAAMLHASAPCHVVHEDPEGDVHALMGLWDLGSANIFTNIASGIRLVISRVASTPLRSTSWPSARSSNPAN